MHVFCVLISMLSSFASAYHPPPNMIPWNTTYSLSPYGINNILTHMLTVACNIISLNDTISQLTPSTASNLNLLSDLTRSEAYVVGNLTDVISVITTTHCQTGKLNCPDSNRLVAESQFHAYLLTSLLNNFVAHKSAFENPAPGVGSVCGIVSQALQGAQNVTQAFGTAAQGIVAEGFYIPEVNFNATWDRAKAVFESC